VLNPLNSEAENVHELTLPLIVLDTFPIKNNVESASETEEQVKVYPLAFVTVAELVMGEPLGKTRELASYVKAACPFPPDTDQLAEDEKSNPVGEV
jgi:hypothetical protein